MTAATPDAAGAEPAGVVGVPRSRLRFLLPLTVVAWLVVVPVLMTVGAQDDDAGQRVRLLAATSALALSVGGFGLALHLDSRTGGWAFGLLIVASLVIVGVVGTTVMSAATLGEGPGAETGLACQRFVEGTRLCPGG